MNRIDLLKELVVHGLKIFNLSDARNLASKLGIPEGSVVDLLSELKDEGWIESIKRGVYCTSSDSGFGAPHEFEVLMALVEPCAVSHWTAMHHHHLTQQIPRKIFALTPTNTPIPRNLLNSYRFIQINKADFFGFEKVWMRDFQVNITDPERTLLDGLMKPQYCGDFLEVLHAFKMRGNELNLDKIIQYALRLGGAVVKRLGWILDQTEIQQEKIIKLEEFQTKGYRKLDPSAEAKGRYNKKWKIQENLGEI